MYSHLREKISRWKIHASVNMDLLCLVLHFLHVPHFQRENHMKSRSESLCWQWSESTASLIWKPHQKYERPVGSSCRFEAARYCGRGQDLSKEFSISWRMSFTPKRQKKSKHTNTWNYQTATDEYAYCIPNPVCNLSTPR